MNDNFEKINPTNVSFYKEDTSWEDIDILDIQLEELPDLDEFLGKGKEDFEELEVPKIIDFLKERKIFYALKALENYLNTIKMNNYKFLIFDLIAIANLENDNTFYEIENILISLKRGTFEYNLGWYIIKFYKTLKDEQYEKARIYLDIIKNSYFLGQPCKITFILENFLEMEKNQKKLKKSKKAWDYSKNNL